MSGGRMKIMVALSGGVDSAVAALRLVQAGHDVAALHMTNWDSGDRYCTAGQDLAEARRVAGDLGIVFHHVNFEREYREQVFAGFLASAAAGLTPNPDVGCNRHIKFGAFLRHAQRLGATCIATGHYARVEHAPTMRLLRARDRSKDQTYFLHAVPASALALALFPLGDLLKPEVRRIARDAGLANHARRDSTGICFVGERPFREFLAAHLPADPGPILDTAGRQLGEHAGLPYYTLGQRHGLGIGGTTPAAEGAWYVAAKDTGRNALIVVQGHDHPWLLSTGLRADQLHWIGERPASGAELTACVRYRHPGANCRLEAGPAGPVLVHFQVPQWAVTPGQHVVFYQGDECLGGGTITGRIPLSPVPAAQPAMT